MHAYILRRILLMFPTLLGITVVVFVVMAAAPGGITAQSLIEGQDLEPQAKKALVDYYNRLYGLDQPPPVQYLRWLNNVSPIGFELDENNELARFSWTKGTDLGLSFHYGRPVTELIKERAPITILLNLLSIPLIYIIAIAVGLRAAVERGKPFDVGSSFVLLALWSAPTMLIGVLCIGFLASNQHWHWFPTAGLSDREALDMPFLPHWSSLWDLLRLGALAIFGAVGFSLIAHKAGRLVRILLAVVVGVIAGYGVAMSHASDPGLTHVIVACALFAGLGGLIAYTQFVALRVSVLGLTGLAVGIFVAVYLADGGFTRGFLLDRIWHLVLPVFCLSYGSFAFLAKLSRTAVLENLLSDYARTARAKGADEQQVLWRHVFRNSLLPLITFGASLLPALLGGSVIVEHLFSIDGMGKLAVEAVKLRDRELVLSVTLISGILTLLGYLIADICYALADPRVSYD